MRPPGDYPKGEEALAGGNVSIVSRVGNTVRRETGPWTPAVHSLLHHLEKVGFGGAPRVLGMDEWEREIFTYRRGLRRAGMVRTAESKSPAEHPLRGLRATQARQGELLQCNGTAYGSYSLRD